MVKQFLDKGIAKANHTLENSNSGQSLPNVMGEKGLKTYGRGLFHRLPPTVEQKTAAALFELVRQTSKPNPPTPTPETPPKPTVNRENGWPKASLFRENLSPNVMQTSLTPDLR